MVRVVSQNFTTPRSRHSSGEEMIDHEAAVRAVGALSPSERNSGMVPDGGTFFGTLVMACDTDTTDSFSTGDSDGEHRVSLGKTDDEQSETELKMSSELRKRRRRERNKVSAQAYRQRRREQTNSNQKMLESLETQQKILLEKIRHLEAEKHIVEEYLKSCVKIPWCPYHHPCQPKPQAAHVTMPTPMPMAVSMAMARGDDAMETERPTS